MADIAQALHGGGRGNGDDRGLFEGETGRLVDELVRSGHRVLGEGTVGDAEHLVTDFELGDVGPDLNDRPGDVLAGNGLLRTTEPEAEYPQQVRLAPHEVRGAPVDAGGTDLHEHFVRRGIGLLGVAEVKDFGRPVDVLQHRFHCCPSR